MKKKLVIIAITFLFLINISALVTIMYKSRFIKKDLKSDEKSITSILKEEFGLNETQAAEITEIRTSFDDERENVGKKLNEKQVELFNAVRSENPDINSINNLIDEISLLQTRLQKEAVKRMIKEKCLLNPIQQERYFRRFSNQFDSGRGFGGKGWKQMDGRGGMRGRGAGRGRGGGREQQEQRENNY